MLESIKQVAEAVRKDLEAVKAEQEGAELLPERTVKNVADLNDRFNRARYMSEDGK